MFEITGSRELAREANSEAFGRCGDARQALRPAKWDALARGDLRMARRIQRALDALDATEAEIRRANELLAFRERANAA